MNFKWLTQCIFSFNKLLNRLIKALDYLLNKCYFIYRDLLDKLKKNSSKTFTLTNIYILSALGLTSILVRNLVINCFELNMLDYLCHSLVIVSSGLFVHTSRVYILNKITNNEIFKCPLYQTLWYILFIKHILVIVIFYMSLINV